MCLVLLLFLQLSFRMHTDNQNISWYGNDHFKIKHDGDIVTIAMNKMPWESFSADVRLLERGEGFLSFDVKSAKAFKLRVDGITVHGDQIELLTQDIGAGDYQQVIQHLNAASARVNHLIFYINPGNEFSGEVQVKGLGISSYSDDNTRVSVFPNPSSGDVIVQLPNTGFQQLVLFDDGGNEVLRHEPSGARGVRLNLQGRKQGIYVLRAISNDGVQTTKLILK
jgi:hypothetical protein